MFIYSSIYGREPTTWVLLTTGKQVQNCNDLIKFRTSQLLPVADQLHYAVKIGAVLGQIATGGGSDHLAEQMACINVLFVTTTFSNYRKNTWHYV